MMLPSWLLGCMVLAALVGSSGSRRSSRPSRRSSSTSRRGPDGGGGEDAEEEDCMTVQQQCASRLGCSIALSNYMLSCGPVVHGQVAGGQCTLECRNALVTLLSMDDRQGEVFMTCRCNGNEICEQQKRRLEVCHEEVIHTVPAVMDNLTDISCTLAQLICSADTSCYTALNYYNRHCQKLMRGEKCSAKCNNSLSILYSQRKARKLRTCICDGSEIYNCEAVRYYTQTLCLSRHRPPQQPQPPGTTTEHVRHHHHPRTPSPTTDSSQQEGWWDREEDYENEKTEETGEEEKGEKENYTGRRKKNLSSVASNSVLSLRQTMLWGGGGVTWILLWSYYLTLLLPVLNYSTSVLLS